MRLLKVFFLGVLLSFARDGFGQRKLILVPGQVVTFTVRNAGVEVGGTMNVKNGEIVIDTEKQNGNAIFAEADVASINTGIAIRDKHLKRADYFDVKSFPVITIKSSKMKVRGSAIRATFDLTIKEITRPVDVTFRRTQKGRHVAYEGFFYINRLDFKLGEKSVILDDSVRVHFSLNAK